MVMTLPKYFCWSKFGTEAGEQIGEIVHRKNQEREINGGVFLWGIGNSLGPSITRLLELEKKPEVIFSPIKSRPKKQDIFPDKVVAWTLGETIFGEPFKLPSGSLVTSRGIPDRKKSHYALVCESKEELKINMNGEIIQSGTLRNLRTGRPIGYSQVTSIVSIDDEAEQKNMPYYQIAMRVKLVYPYFIKLINPITLSKENTLNLEIELQ